MGVVVAAPGFPNPGEGTAVPAPEPHWAAYGHDAGGSRYLPAVDINRDNVTRLEVAWTYRTGETDPRFRTRRETAFEATPLMVAGTLYLATPLGRGIALAPCSGRARGVLD